MRSRGPHAPPTSDHLDPHLSSSTRLSLVTLARDPPQSWPADPERRPASSPASRTGRTPAPPAASPTTGGQTRLRMTCLSRRRGPPPHARTVMSPRARAWLHGSPHATRSSSNFVPTPERPVNKPALASSPAPPSSSACRHSLRRIPLPSYISVVVAGDGGAP
jgi:hypothetical protein